MEKNKKKFNWGTGLFLTVTVFIIGTLSVVSYLISLDFYMVNDNHYEEAVNYQQTIDSRQRAENLENKVVMLFDEEKVALKVIFPEEMVNASLSGTIEFYRPNDSGMDRIAKLKLDENRTQMIPMSDFTKGKWVMKLSWEADSLSYLEEKTILI